MSGLAADSGVGWPPVCPAVPLVHRARALSGGSVRKCQRAGGACAVLKSWVKTWLHGRRSDRWTLGDHGVRDPAWPLLVPARSGVLDRSPGVFVDADDGGPEGGVHPHGAARITSRPLAPQARGGADGRGHERRRPRARKFEGFRAASQVRRPRSHLGGALPNGGSGLTAWLRARQCPCRRRIPWSGHAARRNARNPAAPATPDRHSRQQR